jgi:pentatricopeptide repeat protein
LCLLHECKNKRDLGLARRLHSHIRENGLESHPSIGNHLVPMLVECEGIDDASCVFESLIYRNVHSWASLMHGYVRKGDSIRAIQLYEKMWSDGIAPTNYALVAMLKACMLVGDLRRGREIHGYAVQAGVETNLIIGSVLIDMYAKVCLLPDAHAVCAKLPGRNVVAWSTLIEGYAENNRGCSALECFEQMREEGVLPNPVTFIFVLKACDAAGAINQGQAAHMQIVCRGLEGEVFLANTLISMYSKSGLLDDAYDTFAKLPAKDIGSWNAMIQGYGMNHGGGGELALGLFQTMNAHGIEPDAITFACVLGACGRGNLAAKGTRIFRMMSEVHNIVPMADHVGCLADLLARAGELDEAEKLLESSPFSPPDDMRRSLLSACTKYAEIGIGQRWVHQRGRSAVEC